MMIFGKVAYPVSKMFEVPPAWKKIDFSELRGTISVIGAPDTGKSTFIQYLYQNLRAHNRLTAILDSDPGQSSLGPPAALTLIIEKFSSGEEPQRLTLRSFIGSTTPVGHLLNMVVSVSRLARAAQQAGAEVVLHDTCGFIDVRRGGLALKLAQIDLLMPNCVYAIQRADEMEPLLVPLRRSRRTKVIDIQAAPAARRRSHPVRQAHRARRFADYFGKAGVLQIDWNQLAVFPYPGFSLHRLAALEDDQGFALNLGIIIGIDQEARRLTLLTPQQSLKQVRTLHLGDLEVNIKTFQDRLSPLAHA
jgi:polynucleotide 5'-hydroxyl-kinase GRC3/NOL9